MDPYSGVGGVFGGFFASIAIVLGLRRRIDKMSESVVYKDTCVKCHEATNQRLDTIDGRLDDYNAVQRGIAADIGYIKGKLGGGDVHNWGQHRR